MDSFGTLSGEEQPNKPSEITTTASVLEPVTLQTLPVEILLHVFSLLELKPYIMSQGVCKEWRRLLPLAELHPIRLRMFMLYRKIISTPGFTKTRSWAMENPQSFDRQEYIDALLAQYPVVPEEFRMWILEWPNGLAIAGLWPGFPFVRRGSESYNHEWGIGVNWLAYRPGGAPQLSTVLYRPETPSVKPMPALLVGRAHMAFYWLIFDKDEPEFFGKIYINELLFDDYSPIVIPHDLFEEQESYNFVMQHNRLHADWLGYMEHLWDYSVDCLLKAPTGVEPPAPHWRPPTPDWPIPLPVELHFGSLGGAWEASLPTYPWSLRDTTLQLASSIDWL